MKITEDLSVYDSRSDVVVGRSDKPKVAMKSSGRRTLADISNIQKQPSTSNQSNNPKPSSDTIEKHIKQLQKEKAALMKLLSDKNKIIEENGSEGRKLRVTLQKVQEQNLLLAQSNNQMQTDLISVKDREKALKHEIGCKNGLIIATKLELENRTCQTNEDNDKVTVAENNDDKHNITSRRQKSKSLVPSVEMVQDNDMDKNRRLHTRRQSAMFKVDEPKPNKESIKIDNVDDDEKVKVNESKSRPLREAVKKVQSYKEVKVNTKMRRGENMNRRKSWI